MGYHGLCNGMPCFIVSFQIMRIINSLYCQSHTVFEYKIKQLTLVKVKVLTWAVGPVGLGVCNRHNQLTMS